MEKLDNDVIASHFHPKMEEIVDLLVARTGTQDRNFFRIMVTYKFAEVATNMRANIHYAGTKNIPCNVYALDLAPSGYSKNASMNILDKDIFRGFKDLFMEETMPEIQNTSLAKMAEGLSISLAIDVEEAYMKIEKDYNNLPTFLYQFGASTIEGVKSLRTKLSMANIGATNNIMDEIGHNIMENKDTMKLYFDTYDLGLSKNKLIKIDSNRDLSGAVPCNLFAFGTQSRLLDGATVEKTFFEFLEDGYGRRFLFGYVDGAEKKKLTGAEKYAMIMNPEVESKLRDFNQEFTALAHPDYHNKEFKLSQACTEKIMDYQSICEDRAGELRDHEMILKAVIEHSYWRVLKVSGAYAFIDGADAITEEHIDNAIELAEMSIASFKTMLKREKPYEKLAKYISSAEGKLTQVDLVEDLVFYKGSETQKRDLMNMAVAFGYNNNIIIKKTIHDGIEFVEGETLKLVDKNDLTVSWSKDIAYNYQEKSGLKSEDLYKVAIAKGVHYCSHQFKGGHRNADNAEKGFDILILDVDHGLPIEVCTTLLKEYEFTIVTTKRHTEANHRYRILMPMSHELHLDKNEHKKFMKNVFDFMPFDCDEQTADISRKWQAFEGGEHVYNEGNLIDVLPFIPDTTKQERQKDLSKRYIGVESLQRWFLMNFNEEEGRNNMLIQYALALLDNGMASDSIRHSVYDMNTKLNVPLQERELDATIMKTVLRKEFEREAK